MSAQTVIDGLEFCGAGQELRGHLRLAELDRLRDCLFDASSGIEFFLKGGHDAQKRPILHLQVSGLLDLQCQRCLGQLEYPLQIATALLLVRANEAPPDETDEPDAPDCIESSAELDVAALIEDEILLSLPLSPRHPEGTCTARGYTSRTAGAASPFEQLAALKK